MKVRGVLFSIALLLTMAGDVVSGHPCGLEICIDGSWCPSLMQDSPSKDLLDSSDELFFGTVVRQELVCYEQGDQHVSHGRADITFDVIHRWKGSQVQRVTVRTPPCTQLYPLVLGRNYLVRALPLFKDEPPLLCGMPLDGAAARSLVVELEKMSGGHAKP